MLFTTSSNADQMCFVCCLLRQLSENSWFLFYFLFILFIYLFSGECGLDCISNCLVNNRNIAIAVGDVKHVYLYIFLAIKPCHIGHLMNLALLHLKVHFW